QAKPTCITSFFLRNLLMQNAALLFGPFSEILTMEGMPDKGPVPDTALKIIRHGGIVVRKGVIEEVNQFDQLKKKNYPLMLIDGPAVAMPGLIDSHTHLCFAGSRSRDYSLRISGKTYQDILREGGGIYDTVEKTRAASLDDLVTSSFQRLKRHVSEGVTTCEIKSGYGLSAAEEIKMLRAIDQLGRIHPCTIIATCLAAHVPPKEARDAEK